MIALSLLHSTGQLNWIDPFHYRLTSKAEQPKSNFFDAVKDMKGYLHSKRCRWQMLLAQFGFEADAKTMRCGQCDNCQK
ncbi:MAG: RecQ family zinc-binding domain-containing protein [Cyanobacteria bacterium P01_D01_bin.44]